MKTFIISLLAAFGVWTTPVMADKDPIYTATFSNQALGGFDPVSYHHNGPRKGQSTFSLEYQGAVFLFENAENQARFAANPNQYVPQYGGYCAYAVANGYTAKGDPLQYTLVDDRLYLNFNASVKQRWLTDVPGHVRQGDANWPAVLK